MDEKRTAVAVLLSIVVIMVYSELVMDPYVQRSRTAVPPTAQSATSVPTAAGAVPSAGVANVVAATQAKTPNSTVPSIKDLESGQVFSIHTNLVEAKISSLGGRVLHLALHKHFTTLGKSDRLDLVTSTTGAGLPLALAWDGGDDSAVQYKNISTDPNNLTLVGVLPDGKKIEKNISFTNDSYVIGVQAQVPGVTPYIQWSHYVSAADGHERLNPFEFRWLKDDNKIDYVAVASLHENSSVPQPVRWIKFGDRYFIAALVTGEGLASEPGWWSAATYPDGAHTYFINMLGNSVGHVATRLYVGPKDSTELIKVNVGLERSIDLGWFSFLAFPLLSALKFLHAVFGNWGLAIVALTLCLKALLLPLTKASFSSMRGMQELQPQIAELRKRVTDPTQLNQEMLGLYKKHGVNPLGGCLPVLLQIPIFIGLYNVLLNAIELRHAPFALWITDLSAPEHCVVFGFVIPVMVLILGVSMFVQQYMTPNAGMDPAQRKVMLFMPLVLTGSFLMYPLPAGLTLYWVVNNTISIVQQSFLKTDKRISPYTATAIAGAGMFVFAYILTIV